MIEVNNLCKQFTLRTKGLGMKQSLKSFLKPEIKVKDAVKNVTFEIEEGEVVGFLGPNGAGKTTTLKMLSGILFPTSGEVSVLGYTPWERKNEFKRQISIVLGQKNQLWWDLPANESLYLNKCIYGIEDSEYKRTLNELCGLLQVKDLLDVQVRNLSLGERMKMELVAALLHKPKIIFLDEPTIGLDMIAQKKLVKIKTQDERLDIDDERVHLRSNEGGMQTLEVNKNIVQQVITELLLKYDIKDFSVEDVPLEESLEVLYR